MKLPATFGQDWSRDGLVEKSPGNTGKRTWWLAQILQAIPPTFWESYLSAGPTALLEMLPDNEWQATVVYGWLKAALIYKTPNWPMPLWKWWQDYYLSLKKKYLASEAIHVQLLQCMSRE